MQRNNGNVNQQWNVINLSRFNWESIPKSRSDTYDQYLRVNVIIHSRRGSSRRIQQVVYEVGCG